MTFILYEIFDFNGLISTERGCVFIHSIGTNQITGFETVLPLGLQINHVLQISKSDHTLLQSEWKRKL